MLVDYHEAVGSLRQRYGKCHKILKDSGDTHMVVALECAQTLLESTTPSVLGLESVQQMLHHTIDPLTKTRIDSLYHQAILVFFYSLGIKTKGVLSERLFEKF